MGARFEDLSVELLLNIFEYCSIRDLYQLQNTCTKFHRIIKSATSLGNVVPLLVTNHVQQEMRNKCTKLLTIKEKCYISYNWKNGVYNEKCVCKTRKYIPWLVLTKDCLLLSKGSRINVYKRSKGTLNHQHISHCILCLPDIDFCKFVCKQSYIVSGLQNGDIFIWKTKHNNIHFKNCHQEDVHSVDLDGDIILSGSRDRTVKIWRLEQQSSAPVHAFDMNDRIWSVSFSGGGQYSAIGTAGLNSLPLHIIDTNRCVTLQKLGQNFRKGSGILHMKWENPHILLSCGYDKNVRKWDMRTGACEQSWEDPYYSTVYCFDTDNYCTIVTGTGSYGRAVLWDTRVKAHVQVYFMSSSKKSISSPLYSISFDACNLFAATDCSLNVLDFSTKNGKRRDYSFRYTSPVDFVL